VLHAQSSPFAVQVLQEPYGAAVNFDGIVGHDNRLFQAIHPDLQNI
jgi:hypothetical protein